VIVTRKQPEISGKNTKLKNKHRYKTLIYAFRAGSLPNGRTEPRVPYLPNFILKVDDSQGADDLLNLVIKIKGYRRIMGKALDNDGYFACRFSLSARIMGARYPYYLLADSEEGRLKQQALTGEPAPNTKAENDIRQGFIYQRVPHITLKSIANNEQIDTIWEQFQQQLEPLRKQLNQTLKKHWQEWQIPRETDKK